MINCPAFNSAYLEWIPYQEGDTVIFENDKGFLEEYIVSSYIIYHTNNYPSNIKCCGCNDKIDLCLRNTDDSLKMRLLYEVRDKDVYHITAICNKALYETKQVDSLLYLNINSYHKNISERVISHIDIKKGMGIVGFSNNLYEWTLIKHKKSLTSKTVKVQRENYQN